MGEVRVTEGRAGDRCAYCFDGLGAEPHECATCGVRMHRDCRRTLGRCSTIGCAASAPAERAAEPRRPSLEGFEAEARLVARGALPVLAVTLLALAGEVAAWAPVRAALAAMKMENARIGDDLAFLIMAFVLVLLAAAALACLYSVNRRQQLIGRARTAAVAAPRRARLVVSHHTYRDSDGDERTKAMGRVDGIPRAFEIGRFPVPAWVESYDGRTVTVRGLLTGPWLLELEEGRHALVE